MTMALLESPARAREATRTLEPGDGGRMKLGDLLQSAWRAVHTEGATECPVCQGRMTLRGPTAACGGCGARFT
jgi:hypothetical protein